MSMACRARFGVNVRSLRKAKELFQEYLAESCHLHRTLVSAVERGGRNISIDSMERIAAAMSVGLADLFALTASKQVGSG